MVPVTKLKPAKKVEEFTGEQGASNALSATEWLAGMNWNSTKVPGAAVTDEGLKLKSEMPFFPAMMVWVLLALDDVGEAAAAAAGVVEAFGAGEGAPPYCAKVRGTSRPSTARVFEENIVN